MTKKELIRLIYLYLFSAVGLALLIIGSVRLIDLGLKVFIFKKADFYYYPTQPKPIDLKISEEEWKRQIDEQVKAEQANRYANRQRTASNSIAMIIIGLPLFLYHWRILKKTDNEK